MADEEETASSPSRDRQAASSADSDSDDSEAVETLVAGRSKRATAGNRLTSLIEKEADDDLELLFAEAEDDVEFEGVEGDASDEQLDSSSDDDDQGPDAKGDDEDEGEQDLQRKEKAESRAKKRKAQDAAITRLQRSKKVKIDPTTAVRPPTTPVPRPKKKSERVSWLPTPDEGPVRSSSRRQTVQNKAVTHAKLKVDEQRRLRTLAAMEASARRKEKNKPKEMTQEDRLREAAKTERLNSKTLNRWEEMEKKRKAEEKAKQDALQQRKLEGPVVSTWSGAAKWSGDTLKQVGRRLVNTDHDKRRKKDKETKGRKESIEPAAANVPNEKDHGQSATPAPAVKSEQPTFPDQTQPTSAPQPGPESFLDGIQAYAELPTDSQLAAAIGTDAPSATQQEQTQLTPGEVQAASPQPMALAPKLDAPLPVNTSAELPDPEPVILEDSTASAPTMQGVEPEIQTSVRNLIILENFDSKALQEKGENSIFFTKTKIPRTQKPPAPNLCVITSYPARYRDPETGLPYYDRYGYSQIQKLKAGHCSWSSMLGSYVGEVGIAARGVPDRFFAPFGAPPGSGPIY